MKTFRMNGRFELAYHAVHKGLPLSKIFNEVFKGNQAKYNLWHRNYYQPLYELKHNKELYQRKESSVVAYTAKLVETVESLRIDLAAESNLYEYYKEKEAFWQEQRYMHMEARLDAEIANGQRIGGIQRLIQDLTEHTIYDTFIEYNQQSSLALKRMMQEEKQQINKLQRKINKMQKEQQYSEEYSLLVLLNAI